MKKEINSKNVVFHIISNVISWSIFAILAIIALFLVYYVIAAQLYANKGEKYKPAFALYTIISGSMEPTIKVYDVVFDVKVDDPSKLKEGDVITFVSSSSLTIFLSMFTNLLVDSILDIKSLKLSALNNNIM